jgi:hypothetical protein
MQPEAIAEAFKGKFTGCEIGESERGKGEPV